MISFLRYAWIWGIALLVTTASHCEAQSSGQYQIGITAINAACGVGIKIHSVLPASPATRTKLAADHSVTRSLATGDWITAVNGITLHDLDHFRRTLNAYKGYVVLTVKSSSPRGCGDWVVRGEIGGEDTVADGVRRVHLVMAGSTSDPTNGPAATGSLQLMEKTIREAFDASQVTVNTCVGTALSTKDISAMISSIQSDADDTILWFSHTHGAHNPNGAGGDPSNGHFLNMADSDVLYRNELIRKLQTKSHRLLVVATEACNQLEILPRDVKLRVEQKAMTMQGLTPIAKLLLYHRGLIDFNAAKAGQSSWNADGQKFGIEHQIGVFSFFFATAIRSSDNWDSLITAVDSNAKKFVDQLNGKKQDLAVFQKSVTQDKLPMGSVTDATRSTGVSVFIYEDEPTEK